MSMAVTGVVTAIVAGVVATVAAVAGAYVAAENAEDQANAAKREGRQQQALSAKRTRARAASQRTSFLSSGLTLEGTPQNVLDETYTMGIQDVVAIKEFYDTKAHDAKVAGRMAIIQGIAGSAQGVAAIGSAFKDSGSKQSDVQTFSINSTGGTPVTGTSA